MLSLFACALATQSGGPTIGEPLAISGVAVGGRRPIPDDAVLRQIVAGEWLSPTAGATVAVGEQTRTWRMVKPDKDGGYDANGYLFVPVEAPADGVYLLNASGDTLVYVNGALRAGDPYGYGYLTLPIHLRQGHNELLFVAQRGAMKFSIAEPSKLLSLQGADACLPDILTDDRKPLDASVVALNATDNVEQGLTVKCTLPGGQSAMMADQSIPPCTAKKLQFRIPVSSSLQPGKISVQVELLRSNQQVDSTNLEVTVKDALTLHKRTFVSNIDGSVQYYAVNPASKPSSANALLLTLHGASVEATGQAAAYAQKDWVTIVAPTNRRPYGFDWEDIGRLDALEVLRQAEETIPHDPERVDLAGHSMGGHGTWAVGTLFPNLFASIAPSAGWISFWSYGGGWNPTGDSPTEKLLRRSMNVGDTLGRIDNTLAEDVYILHGDADDNVPVTEARTMHKKLLEIGHPHLEYHEQPGAGHWWGNQCVDWPPIFQMVEEARLAPHPQHIDFTTQNPAVSADEGWITVEQQIASLDASRIVADRTANGKEITITTSNVAAFTLHDIPQFTTITVDGQSVRTRGNDDSTFVLEAKKWARGKLPRLSKSPTLSGPFKEVFDHDFLFVVGTSGDDQENAWARNSARYASETLMYRGNGSVDIVTDKQYDSRKFRRRNVLLFGNSDTNSAWKPLLGESPIQVSRGSVMVGAKGISSDKIGALLIYPKPGEPQNLVGAVCGSGMVGMRETDRMTLFGSGIAYPDWILLSPGVPSQIVVDGFYGNDWTLGSGEIAWAPGQ